MTNHPKTAMMKAEPIKTITARKKAPMSFNNFNIHMDWHIPFPIKSDSDRAPASPKIRPWADTFICSLKKSN